MSIANRLTSRLYGTTNVGGASYCFGGGCGTVFELSPPATAGGTWTKKVLYSFTGGSDGGNPQASLIADSKGNLYCTTNAGGASNAGTVFELSPPASAGAAWTETVLYAFTGGSDGGKPQAGLIFDSSGAFYGTTFFGGSYSGVCAQNGCGTVFKLTPPATASVAWTETVLYSFLAGGDAYRPSAGVIFDTSGALYGTTPAGGIYNQGTVFKLTPPATGQTQWTETVLYNFTGGPAPTSNDGAGPTSGVIFDGSGALYGTTQVGGTSGYGTVFKLTPPAWTETVLHSFTGSDGRKPYYASLIFDESGALYGTTYQGGAGCASNTNGCGTVFKLSSHYRRSLDRDSAARLHRQRRVRTPCRPDC